jgi:hypothetical protein
MSAARTGVPIKPATAITQVASFFIAAPETHRNLPCGLPGGCYCFNTVKGKISGPPPAIAPYAALAQVHRERAGAKAAIEAKRQILSPQSDDSAADDNKQAPDNDRSDRGDLEDDEINDLPHDE